MKNFSIILFFVCLIFSCAGNKASSFYSNANKIYGESKRKINDFLFQKETSEEKVAVFLDEKITELNALPDFSEGVNLKKAMIAELSMWQKTFSLSEKINHADLNQEEKNALTMERLDLQTNRNPLNQDVERENNLFAEKFKLEPLNSFIKIKPHK